MSGQPFNAQQEDMLREFMKPENLVLLGWSGASSGGAGVSSLTELEIATVLASIPEGAAKDARDYALHKEIYTNLKRL